MAPPPAAPPGAHPAPGGASASLWTAHRAEALACLSHPFVRGLADGSLSERAFKGYVAQDAFFLAAFAAAYRAARAHAEVDGDADAAATCATLEAAVEAELGLHASYAAKWGVDISTASPAPATAAYCAFLQRASTQGLAHTLAAMAPCSRLYGWLGVSLSLAGAAAGPYQDWIDTYASAAYLAAPAAKEALLDRLVAAGAATQAALTPLYATAMRHEVMFFNGAMPAESEVPKALVVDFDETLTAADTTAAVIAAALANEASPETRTELAGVRDALVARYIEERDALFAAALPSPPLAAFDAAAVATFLTRLSDFDRSANARAFGSGLLAASTAAALAAAGAAAPLRPGAAAALCAAVAAGVPTGVLSVSWSADLILGALAAAGAPPADRAPWPAAPLAAGPSIAVLANDVATAIGTGAGADAGRRVECADDKAAALGSLTSALPGAGPVVFVGDSPSDLGALLAADVGIVIDGGGGSLRRVAAALGVALRPLAAAPASFASIPPGTLYTVNDWDQVSAFALGGRKGCGAPAPYPPTLLSIAGSDSGGGAGIQADVKTAAALGVFAATAITAVTVQNTGGVAGVHAVPPATVRAQVDAVLDDVAVGALKTGMLATVDIVKEVAAALRGRRGNGGGAPPLVVDPVLASTSGDALASGAVAAAIKEHLFPLATVVTPNLGEAAALLGTPGADLTARGAAETAALSLAAAGPAWVLVKGGHGVGEESVDFLAGADGTLIRLAAPRVATPVSHGTGCTLATAIAAGLARGLSVPDATRAAKAFVSAALTAAATAPRVGRGPQWPMNHSFATAPWTNASHLWPPGAPADYRLYAVTDPGLDAAAGRGVGAAVAAAVAGGATVVQVRAKDASIGSLVDDVTTAVAAAGGGAPVLVNDRCDAALAAFSAGAHVGQADLPAAAARTALGPLRILGVSVKTPAEARAAEAAGADYVGAGAVFPTGTKPGAGVIGLDGLAAVCQAVAIPVVAIGGVTEANAASAIRAGASGVAVVSALFAGADVEGKTRRLRAVVDAALAERGGGA